MSKDTRRTNFTLTGQFIAYVLADNCEIKGIRLTTTEGERYIKLSKVLRPISAQILQPGSWIQVQGSQKIALKTGKAKFKAHSIIAALPDSAGFTDLPVAPAASAPLPPPQDLALKQVGKIRICQKSSCRKRGSQRVLSVLNSAIRDAGLDQEIELSEMGCVGKCKAGPNLIVLPDKTRYTKVKPQNIPKILEHHF
ncbi:MAG: (2Fe-2S) ferredoxin domain-containing protein [Acaryochloridaceae cyanobacterium SU_2_1]|nr:(2Fe-2S) ferredoxin domain-containing protein [Acaryochloridaceae cyanobacterium SU_2_1]